MTIAELLGRIGLAFERTFDLVMKGAFGDVVLWDVGIIVGVGYPALFVGSLVLWVVWLFVEEVIEGAKNWWRSSRR